MNPEGSFIAIIPSPHWLGGLVPVRVESIGQIELFNYLQYLQPFNDQQIEKWVLESNTCNHLTMCKQIIDKRIIKVEHHWLIEFNHVQRNELLLVKNVTYKQFAYKSYDLHIYIYIFIYRYIYIYIYIYIYTISFQTFFVWAFKIVFSMLLPNILWDDWPIFMILGSKEQLQQELEYTLLKPDCHSWWISKM